MTLISLGWNDRRAVVRGGVWRNKGPCLNQFLVFCSGVEAAHNAVTVGYVSNGNSTLVVNIFRIFSRCHPILFWWRHVLLLVSYFLIGPLYGRLAPFLCSLSLIRRVLSLLEVMFILSGERIIILKTSVLVKAHIISTIFVFFNAILFNQAQIT